MTDAGSVVDYRALKGRLIVYPNELVHLSFFIMFNPTESGAFGRYFTINLSPHCGTFTRALYLKI